MSTCFLINGGVNCGFDWIIIQELPAHTTFVCRVNARYAVVLRLSRSSSKISICSVAFVLIRYLGEWLEGPILTAVYTI